MVGLLKTVMLRAKTHIALPKLTQFKNVMVVMGNETCDLDSAVSSLVYSLFLHHQVTPNTIVVPVMNIPRIQLPIKTEVLYVFNKYGLELEHVICRDEIDLISLQRAGTLKLVLVDHHVLQPCDSLLANSVVTIIDHRPQDPAWPWTQTELSLSTVGSCCSLVADKLLAQAPDLVTPAIAVILLGTILLDTANLSPAAGRATPFDHQVVEQLTVRCSPTYSVQSNQLFTELQTAKSNISTLTSAQLLIKDMKVAAKIPIAGLPMKVETFLQRQDAVESIDSFCEENHCGLCVLYGMDSKDGILSRDIAVYSMEENGAKNELISALKESQDPFLNLQTKPCMLPGVHLFEQINIKYSRKQVLPIVRQIGEKLN